MPAMMSFDIKRARYAEQFVERLRGTTEQILNESLSAIATDIAAEAPKKTGALAGNFRMIPAQPIAPMVWEGYIASSTPEKARALEYGSGLHGPAMAKYPIYPKNARFLTFRKEGRVLRLPMVMHPGVYAHHYIDTVLRRWRPVLTRRFGEAIQLAAVHHWGTY